MSDLELTRPVNGELQKQIEADVKTIRMAIAGNMRAKNLFFAYAAIAGARANHLMEIAPHGEGEKILREEFPQSENTIKNWRNFAKKLEPALADKRPTVGLLNAPGFSKKSIPAKAAAAIQEAVMEVMDGSGMMEFMRASKALREPSPVGGANGNHHSGPRTPNAEEQRENAKLFTLQWARDISELARDQVNFNLATIPDLETLADACLTLRKRIDQIKDSRKK